ncbi:MAG: DUF4381 domain-containing protein [Bacteroidales bacterium]|nr:DUF4381 domain-containing protein [Bacteroidales bacterium]
MRQINNILILIIFGMFAAESFGQVTAEATLDTSSIPIGGQTHLNLIVSYQADYTLKWPILEDTITGDIEILRKTRMDSVVSENKESITKKLSLTITCFDSGYYAIPPFKFRYTKPGDTTAYTSETRALLLGVTGVEIDPSADIRDIREPQPAPFTFREALPWIIIILVLSGLIYFILFYLKKRKKAEPIFRPSFKPGIPPYQLALDTLDTLKRKKLWQNGHLKEYYTELTDIVRTYIEGQFHIQALESTTEEILENILPVVRNDQARQKLQESLLLADLVKFAKEKPQPLENDVCFNYINDFIRESYLAGKSEDETDPAQVTSDERIAMKK